MTIFSSRLSGLSARFLPLVLGRVLSRRFSPGLTRFLKLPSLQRPRFDEMNGILQSEHLAYWRISNTSNQESVTSSKKKTSIHMTMSDVSKTLASSSRRHA